MFLRIVLFDSVSEFIQIEQILYNNTSTSVS